MRTTIAVGRVDGRSREVVWLRARRDEAFPGPWRVRAVVGGPAPEPARRDGPEDPGPGKRSRAEGAPQIELFG